MIRGTLLTKALDRYINIFEARPGPSVHHFFASQDTRSAARTVSSGRACLDYGSGEHTLLNEQSRVTWEGVSAHVTNARDTA